MVEAAP